MTSTIGTLTVRKPEASKIPSPPDRENGAQEERLIKHYQHVILDVGRAELSVEHSDYTDPYDCGPRNGELYAPSASWYARVPDRMYWSIDSSPYGLGHLDAAALGRLLDELAGYAQQLVDALDMIPDAGALDWSAAAIDMGDAMIGLVSRDRNPRRNPRPVADMDEAVAVKPSIVQLTWTSMNDAQLDAEAETLSRFLTSEKWHPELNDTLVPERDGRVDIVNTRAWLYRHREQHAAGRLVTDAATWFQQRPPRPTHGIDAADLSDNQIIYLAQAEQDVATGQNRLLVGSQDYLRRLRTQQRNAMLGQLDSTGNEVAELEEALKQARLRRGSALARVLSWNDPNRVGTDAELAKRAGMTRQGLAKVRERFSVDVDTESADGE